MELTLTKVLVGWHRRWCNGCRVGDHFKCTGVGCYECPHPYHERKPGVTR